MPKGQPSGARVNWDEANKAKLFMAILECSKIDNIPWDEVVKKIGIEGVSNNACQLQYQKLKRAASGEEGSRAATPKTASAKKGKIAAPAATSDNDDDEVPLTPSKTPSKAPAKKRMPKKASARAAATAENSEDEEKVEKADPPKTPKKRTPAAKKVKTPAAIKSDAEEETPKTPASKKRGKSVPAPTPDSDSDNTPTPKKRVKAEAASDDENEEEEKQLAKKSKKENGWTAINEKKANGKAKTEAEGDENEDSKEDVDMKEEEKPDNEEAV